jgi:hypothetical protein
MKEKDPKKKLYLVETVSMFRISYMIEAESEEDASEEVMMNVSGDFDENFYEFSQKHLDEVIVSTRQIKRKDFIDLFDKENDYLKSWDVDKKMEYINKIDYDKYKKNSSNW